MRVRPEERADEAIGSPTTGPFQDDESKLTQAQAFFAGNPRSGLQKGPLSAVRSGSANQSTPLPIHAQLYPPETEASEGGLVWDDPRGP
jgi:hypothetical protein